MAVPPSPHTQTANALAAIKRKQTTQVPTIDFSQHQLENGEVVSTTERMVKDVSTARTFNARPPSPSPGLVCDTGGSPS